MAAIPFVLKVVDRPGGFTRCDAAVLYLQRGGFGGARRSLASVAAAVRPITPSVPAFTKALSRGHSRRRAPAGARRELRNEPVLIVAEGTRRAREQGAVGLGERLEAVARRFADHGLDVDHPYLAAGSTARYAL